VTNTTQFLDDGNRPIRDRDWEEAIL